MKLTFYTGLIALLTRQFREVRDYGAGTGSSSLVGKLTTTDKATIVITIDNKAKTIAVDGYAGEIPDLTRFKAELRAARDQQDEAEK